MKYALISNITASVITVLGRCPS